MTQRAPSLSMVQVLIFGSLMVTLSMGIRHGFGLFNMPLPPPTAGAVRPSH